MEAEELLRSAKKTERAAIVSRTFSGRNLENIKVLARKLTGRHLMRC